MISHVTYHVPPGTLDRDDLATFMSALGLREIDPRDSFEHGWKVRWFRPQHQPFGILQAGPDIHLVEGQAHGAFADQLTLGHFCISGNRARFAALRSSRYVVRDSGSGRFWLQFENLRVEVRE